MVVVVVVAMMVVVSTTNEAEGSEGSALRCVKAGVA